jgi:hypothetical protein
MTPSMIKLIGAIECSIKSSNNRDPQTEERVRAPQNEQVTDTPGLCWSKSNIGNSDLRVVVRCSRVAECDVNQLWRPSVSM